MSFQGHPEHNQLRGTFAHETTPPDLLFNTAPNVEREA